MADAVLGFAFADLTYWPSPPVALTLAAIVAPFGPPARMQTSHEPAPVVFRFPFRVTKAQRLILPGRAFPSPCHGQWMNEPLSLPPWQTVVPDRDRLNIRMELKATLRMPFCILAKPRCFAQENPSEYPRPIGALAPVVLSALLTTHPKGLSYRDPALKCLHAVYLFPSISASGDHTPLRELGGRRARFFSDCIIRDLGIAIKQLSDQSTKYPHERLAFCFRLCTCMTAPQPCLLTRAVLADQSRLHN